MMPHTRSHDPTRSRTDPLARVMASGDGRSLLNELRWLGLFGNASGDPARAESKGPRAIGPWVPSFETGRLEFVRTDPWDRYLWLERRDRFVAERPGSSFRAVLVGESVAAGMFFAPAISPALVLERMLEQSPPMNAAGAEVLDLSRNAMRLGMAVDLVGAAGQLGPDVLLVFVGNNFARDHTVGRPDTSAESLARLNRSGPRTWNAVTEAFQDHLREAAADAVERIARSATCRVVWIVPSCASRWPRVAPCPRLGGNRTSLWHHAFRAATEALARGDGDCALELGEQMHELDSGVCPTAFTILAAASLLLGRYDDARRFGQHAVDSDLVLQRPTFLAPGIHSVVRSILIESAKVHGHDVIDVEAILRNADGGGVADGQHYMDYCHLSEHGTYAVMTAVAALLRGHDGTSRLVEAQRNAAGDNHTMASPQVIGRARFDAAIYASHLSFHPEATRDAIVLRDSIEAACEAFPSILDSIDAYVRMRRPNAVLELTAAAHALVQSTNSLLDWGILRWIELLDPTTISTLCSVLQSHGRAGDERLVEYSGADRRRMRAPGGLDIAQPRFLERFARDGLVDWDPERGTRRTQPTLRSLWPDLTLAFPSDASTGIRCRLTARVPESVAERAELPVTISINERHVGSVTLCSSWSRHELTIDQGDLRAGFNRLTVHWPSPPAEPADAPSRSIDSYLSTGSVAWFPVFGEIFSCWMQTISSGS